MAFKARQDFRPNQQEPGSHISSLPSFYPQSRNIISKGHRYITAAITFQKNVISTEGFPSIHRRHQERYRSAQNSSHTGANIRSRLAWASERCGDTFYQCACFMGGSMYSGTVNGLTLSGDDFIDDAQLLQQQYGGVCITGTIPSLCIASQNNKVCVKMPVIPASICLFELRCIKKEMFQAHFTCGSFALET